MEPLAGNGRATSEAGHVVGSENPFNTKLLLLQDSVDLCSQLRFGPATPIEMS
jgi:hypothetical protein